MHKFETFICHPEFNFKTEKFSVLPIKIAPTPADLAIIEPL